MQPGDNQEEEEGDSSLYAMSAAFSSSAQLGPNNMMRGGFDESSYELGQEEATVDSASISSQTLSYNSQYMGSYPPVGWYAPPLPPTSSQYNYHHPSAHQPMYSAYHVPPAYSHGAHPAQYQHLQYPPNDSVIPRHGLAKSNIIHEDNENMRYALTGDRLRDFRSALYFVRKNPSATLFDIDGFISEMAKADEGASRFVQRRLQIGTDTERRLALQAALRSFSDLWPDPFGNFMLQGLLDYGSTEMREELMTAVFAADVVDMTLNMHGCRVIQKALLVLDQDSACKIITELQDIEEVIPFIYDPNGNHVIQRAIQIVSNFSKSAADRGDIDDATNLMNQMKFIIDDVSANVEQLSKHRYGCRVVQRVIEHCPDEQRDEILTGIANCHRNLIEDQFGNYVVQQAISIGCEEIIAAIADTIADGDLIFKYSKHKYASNVVEVMLATATTSQKEAILNALLKDFEGCSGVVQLAKDPIANYVVKKALDCAEGQQKEKLFAVITSNRQTLSQAPYAKYVLVKLGERRPSRSSRRSKGQDATSNRY